MAKPSRAPIDPDVPLFAIQNFVTWRNPGSAKAQGLIGNHGEGPFMVSRVNDDPGYYKTGEGHPQMVTIVNDKGEEPKINGAWFKRYQ